MIFDSLCRFAERQNDRLLISTLRQSHLFCVEHDAVDFAADIQDNACLPYRTVALCSHYDNIEKCFLLSAEEDGPVDRVHMLMLERTNDEQKRKAKWFHERTPEEQATFMREEFHVIITAHIVRDGGEWAYSGLNIGYLVGKDMVPAHNEEVKQFVEEQQEVLAAMAEANAMIALLYLSQINSIDYFILEETPSKQPHLHKDRILRSHERPQYCILRPRAIRQIVQLADPEEEHGHKAPHERRGCWRTYRDDRYVNVKGKRVWIHATWIGDDEAIVGNRKYRVILGDMNRRDAERAGFRNVYPLPTAVAATQG